jgi:DeoR/GlpR family transcriptional regulator of sugar metabolism
VQDGETELTGGTADRQQSILAMLAAEQFASIADLSARFQVSRETIRKDLYTLERGGSIHTMRGGAEYNMHNRESDYRQRHRVRAREKHAIAACAAKHIEIGMSVYIDYGTTTFLLAEEAAKLRELTAITNTLPIAQLLLGNPQLDVIVPGGQVRKNEDSLQGPLGVSNLQRLHMDVGFFGCAGVDPTAGVTNFDILEAEFSRVAFAQCSERYLLADHSKFGLVAMNKVVDLEACSAVITDELTDPADIDGIRRAGIRVEVAPSAGN